MINLFVNFVINSHNSNEAHIEEEAVFYLSSLSWQLGTMKLPFVL